MDFIKQCFEEHIGTFTEKLESVGFSAQQALEFLPETASGVLPSSQSSDIAQAINDLLSDNPAQLLNSINVDSIAQKLGIEASQVRSGIGAIEPALSEVMSQNKEGIVDAISSLAWGSNGNLNSVTKYFN